MHQKNLQNSLSPIKKITLAVFFFGFLFFKPFQLKRFGMLYQGDDASYLAYATSIAFGEYPRLEKEYVNEFSAPPLSRAGAGFMMLPLTSAFSLVDRITQHPITDKRTFDNIASSWTIVGAFCSSILFFWLTCVLLFNGMNRFVDEKSSLLALLFMILLQGIPIYVFRRPIFSHVYEMFLQTCFVSLFLESYFSKAVLRQKSFWIKTAALSLLAMLVRQNGIVYAAFWPLIYFSLLGKASSPVFFQRALKFGFGFIFILGLYHVIKNIPYWANPEPFLEANKTFETSSFLFQFERPYFYFKRFLTILFGYDWGLIFTAPFLLLGFIWMFFWKNNLKRWWFILCAPLFINLYLLLIWKGQGSYYGYRYLLFPAIPLIIFPLADLIQYLGKKSKKAILVLAGLAIFPFLSMMLFESTETTDIQIVVTEFGERNGGNLIYQLSVWHLLFHEPIKVFYSLIKGGPVFFIHFFSHAFHLAKFLPQKFHEMYPTFDLFFGVRALFCYFFVWLPYFILKRRIS